AIGRWPEMLVWTINGTMIVCDWVTAITPIERNDLSICVLAVPDFVADLREDAICLRQSALQIPRSITDTCRSSGTAEGLALRAGSG
ncbi:hypothetical protein KJ810_02375, partial [Patescibacteria group bacterium]|nr:hypothetical protein [Patescibacteria group bacterium]